MDMKNITYKTGRHNSAFTLAEVLAALTIGSMVLVAVLAIYSRAERTVASITHKLDSRLLPHEVLQRIAEDLDGIIGSNSDTRIVIKNKFDGLYSSARLEILKTINDNKNKPLTFEKIVWQSSYDYDSWAEGLVLYRSHSGITVEDKLLDEERTDREKEYPFVPICEGVTFFKIQVPRGEDFLDQWSSSSLPKGITVTISFAESFKTVTGTFDVPDEEKITRTIAVNRSRKIKFKIVKKEFDELGQEIKEDQEGEENLEGQENEETEQEQEDNEEQAENEKSPKKTP
ncbi:MAG: PulJ/GspJ family protein [Planctomycetota bacterium]|jgi:hypothetical protein